MSMPDAAQLTVYGDSLTPITARRRPQIHTYNMENLKERTDQIKPPSARDPISLWIEYLRMVFPHYAQVMEVVDMLETLAGDDSHAVVSGYPFYRKCMYSLYFLLSNEPARLSNNRYRWEKTVNLFCEMAILVGQTTATEAY